jgi:hypothetical protein
VLVPLPVLFFAVEVVVDTVVAVVSLLFELRFVLDPFTTIRKATTAAMSAKGARKRAGLLLVRLSMAA